MGDRLLAAFFGGAGFSGDQDVEIADGFAAAAQRSGGRDLVDAGKFLEICSELFGLFFGGVDQETPADAAIVFDGLEQLGFMLFAHAGQFADFVLRAPVSRRRRRR